jgi:hypothetical protein
VTLSAVSTLKTLALDYQEAGTNFFLGLGLHYPHQSWCGRKPAGPHARLPLARARTHPPPSASPSGPSKVALIPGLPCRHVPLNVTSQYPSATAMAPAKHQEAPQNAPDIAFTAELDGDPVLGVNCDLPGLRPTCPSNVSGLFQRDCPTPRNNTVPLWMQQQLRLGYCKDPYRSGTSMQAPTRLG